MSSRASSRGAIAPPLLVVLVLSANSWLLWRYAVYPGEEALYAVLRIGGAKVHVSDPDLGFVRTAGRLHHKSLSEEDLLQIGVIPTGGKAFVLDADL
jgi:hypothetical protein